MRSKLDVEALRVETTVMQPASIGDIGLQEASILYDTRTRPIIRNTNSSPCVA